MRLTSTHNPTIAFIRSLERAAVRRHEGLYIAEGVRLVHEAVEATQQARLVLYDPSAMQRSEDVSFLERIVAWAEESHEVTPHVMKAASDTETPSGVLAVLRFPAWPPLADMSDFPLGVVLDGVADPGNVGTIARTALAAGAGYLIAAPGSADLFSPKVVRAGMGAHFRLPMYSRVSWADVSAWLPRVSLVAATTDAKETFRTFEWPDPLALVVGNEARGLSAEADVLVSHRVRIPMQRHVESLNASVAAGILLYAAASVAQIQEAERYK